MEMVLSSWLNSSYVGSYSLTTTRSSSTLCHFPNNIIVTIISRRKQQQQLRCKCLSLESDSPQLQIIASASYGALLLAGGLFAYTRSGSKGSLYGGLAGSSLMAAAFVLMQSSETREIGDSLAFGSALLFTFVFGIRLAATRKIIPAGPLLALSMGASVVFILAYLQDSQSLM